ncbi:MAG: transglutaminase domain-containing protein [Gorillibacterium sp.]|nr:transglutaminase domain-containing protein [Gorillibacterium sp.]
MRRRKTLLKATASRLASYLSVHWQKTLILLFTGLFLVAFIHWFGEEEGGLLPHTRMLIYLTMLLTFVTEVAALKNRYLQRIIQVILITALHVVALDFTLIIAKPESLREFGHLVYYNVEQLYPYYWFSLGAWALYLAAVWWMTKKRRIAIAMIAGILAMALRDSFSLIYLWDEAALLILSGLFLLVTGHFSNLQKKNPEGWGYIADYPVSFVTPIILLLTLTVGVGTLLPDVRNVLTDPYTLYKHWEGETVTLGGKLSNVTLPVTPAFRSTSGYGRDDTSLGGGFTYDYTEVFTVETSHRSYWRGETKAFYTGKGWENSEKELNLPNYQINGSTTTRLEANPLVAGSKLKTVEVKQTVTFSDKAKFPILFGALSIAALDQEAEQNADVGTLNWDPASSELQLSELAPSSSKLAKQPKQYSVISQMPILDEAGLRTALANFDKTQLADYLQLPDNLPQRVKQLALDITTDATTPYDKVKAVEVYLQSTYPYTNEPNEHKGGSTDFVDKFLFETMEGYCDYFSTSMAVLVRSLGMPARWVKGFTSGTSERDSSIPEEVMRGEFADTDPDGAGTYTVHNSNAHSWVEVYFEGWGWVPFEPTSGFSVPYAVDAAVPQDSTKPDDTDTDTSEIAIDEADSLPMSLWISLGSVAVVLLGIGVWFFAGYRKNRWIPRWIPRGHTFLTRSPKSELTYNRLLIKEYEKLLRYSKKRGFAVYDYETARETITRWRNKDTFLSPDLDKLIPLFEKAKYSPRSVTAEELARAEGLVLKLRKEL